MKRAEATPTKNEKVLQSEKLPIGLKEARFLVSNYYTSQKMRKRVDMQIRHLGDREMPYTLQRTADVFAADEASTKKDLERFARESVVGLWMLENMGIGPIIASGFLAHFDITKAASAAHFWSFAGMNPSMKWEKGQKRPYNAEVRQLCWHLGQCVKRVSGSEKAYYGLLYKARKEQVSIWNEEGKYKIQAENFRLKDDTKATKETITRLAAGKVPNFVLDGKACAYVARMFLSHLHSVMFWNHYHLCPPKPYALAHQRHVDFIAIPYLAEFAPGLKEAMAREHAIENIIAPRFA